MAKMATICKCCERDVSGNDTRFGICWDCAEAESIIADGTDMYDRKNEKCKGLEDHSIHMSKLKVILKTYGVIKKNKK